MADGKPSIFDKLTDPKLYTGSHKNRFDEEGKGKGKAGREDLHQNDGYVASFSKTKGEREIGAKESEVINRLTDPKLYTGAHKNRFDEEGKGKGKAGRVDVVHTDGYVEGFIRNKDSPAKSSPAKKDTPVKKTASTTALKAGEQKPKATISVRAAAEDSDFADIFEIFSGVSQAGDNYVYPDDLSEDEVRQLWLTPPDSKHYFGVFVATAARHELVLEGEEAPDEEHANEPVIVGTYVLKPNSIGRGSHVATATYMVHPKYSKGFGIARAMGEHSISEAKKHGFKAMQFNLVVSTNKPFVELWKKLGFDIAGILPKVFNHKDQGLVDGLIMYRLL